MHLRQHLSFTQMFIFLSGFPKDPKQMTQFALSAYTPFIRIVGMYNVTGKILLLPVAGADEGEVKFGKLKKLLNC